ncbi:MAG TPA: DUF418 domain-containing protein [Polyangiaceae bacterium]|nr:DUF418 domain-containing protein [Polyangiaceae bacterium]
MAAAPERLDEIDVIRGLALAGVALGNLLESFRVPWIAGPYEVPDVGPADRAVEEVLNVAFSGLTVTVMFSALFGLGLAIAFERARARGLPAYRPLVRRQIALLGIGLAHAVFLWNGDILSSYAVTGLLVLPLLGRSPRVLAVAALLSFAAFFFPWRGRPRAPGEAERALARALEAYGHGTWREVFDQRVGELPSVWRGVALPSLPLTLLSFCLGIAVWQSGLLLAPPARQARAWRPAAAAGLACLAYILAGRLGLVPRPRSIASGLLRQTLFLASHVGLALAYGAGLLLLMRRRLWRAWLLRVAPLGRMALTNYLMHSVVVGFIFYGYGLGQYARHGMAVTAVLGFAVYGLQVVLSALWLRHFRAGPAEWLWRSLAEGERLPFRRPPAGGEKR